MQPGSLTLAVGFGGAAMAKSDPGFETGLGEKIQQMREQGVLAPVGDFLTGIPVAMQGVGDGRGRHRLPRPNRRFQEGAAEGQNGGSL